MKPFGRLMPVTHELAGHRFTVVKHGRRYATPLLLALVAVEVTDLIFAVDSIPAIFAVTRTYVSDQPAGPAAAGLSG